MSGKFEILLNLMKTSILNLFHIYFILFAFILICTTLQYIYLHILAVLVFFPQYGTMDTCNIHSTKLLSVHHDK